MTTDITFNHVDEIIDNVTQWVEKMTQYHITLSPLQSVSKSPVDNPYELCKEQLVNRTRLEATDLLETVNRVKERFGIIKDLLEITNSRNRGRINIGGTVLKYLF